MNSATTNHTRLPFEYATDAELILGAHTCGIDETDHAHLIDADVLSARQRTQIIEFIRGEGFKSIQVDMSNRITNPNCLTPFDASCPVHEEPNLVARHSPDRGAAVAFLQALGLKGVRYVRRGSFDSPPALYECDWKSARSLVDRITANGSIKVNDYSIMLQRSHTPNRAAIRYALMIYGAEDAVGHIRITSYIGTRNCHIEFTNYVA